MNQSVIRHIRHIRHNPSPPYASHFAWYTFPSLPIGILGNVYHLELNPPAASVTLFLALPF